MKTSTHFRARIASFLERPWAVPLLAALAVFAVYWKTLAPTVTGEDSGELIAAAYVLGIPHPPGYPLWCVIAHAFTWIPFGEVAWHVNLMSAVFGAATVFLVARFTQHLTGRRMAGLAAGLALGFSREFWEQSLIAEVYTLNAFLMILCIGLVWRWRETREAWRLWTFAVVYGLSLGNHNTMLVLGPFFAIFVVLSDGVAPKALARYVGLAVVGMVCAVAIYAYLPLRSLGDPAVDWGNPETLTNWWRHIQREQYAFMYSENPRSAGRFAWQLTVMGRLWFWEFTPWVGLAGLFGVAALVWRERWRGLWLVLIFIAPVVAVTYVQNFSYSQEWFWVMTVFLLPGSLLTAIGVGVLIAVDSRPLPGAALTTLALLSTLFWNSQFNDKSNFTALHDVAAAQLDRYDPNTIYIPRSDHRAFVTQYLQVVEGRRPDITLGRSYGYLNLDMITGMRDALEAKYGAFPRGRDEAAILGWLMAHTDRPVVIEQPVRIEPNRYTRDATYNLEDWYQRGARDPLGEFTLGKAFPKYSEDYTLRLMMLQKELARWERWCAQTLPTLDETALLAEEAALLAACQRSLGLYGADPVALNKLGVVFARNDLHRIGQILFEGALILDPNFPPARNNLTRSLDKAPAAIDGQARSARAQELVREVRNYYHGWDAGVAGSLFPPVLRFPYWPWQ